jgi:hypothetical protein
MSQQALARKNHAKFAATPLLRARQLFNSRWAAVKEPDLKEMDRISLSLYPSLAKSSGILRRSRRIPLLAPKAFGAQISKDL